jgi:transcriptional regulator with XRE-family HTH domain
MDDAKDGGEVKPGRLAREINRVRRSLDLTRDQLAEQIGHSAQTIWRYESGRTEPKGAFLRDLERVAGLREYHFDQFSEAGVAPSRTWTGPSQARTAYDLRPRVIELLRAARDGQVDVSGALELAVSTVAMLHVAKARDLLAAPSEAQAQLANDFVIWMAFVTARARLHPADHAGLAFDLAIERDPTGPTPESVQLANIVREHPRATDEERRLAEAVLDRFDRWSLHHSPGGSEKK